MQLSGKRAIITGSTSGIGLGIARSLAGIGADLVINSFTDTEQDHALAADLGPNLACRSIMFARICPMPNSAAT